MYSFRKSKKGFTLIELMVVVAIIAVLALLGLRMYSTQQDKAKEAIVKANAGTVQVGIQTELGDHPTYDASSVTITNFSDLDALRNPFSGTDGFANTIFINDTAGEHADTSHEGFIGVYYSDPIFYINAYGKDGRDMNYHLTAQR